MKMITDWMDRRTGCRGLLKAMLYEHIPGGARWRYVWGSTLAFAFVVQMITGFFLWMSYSPSAQTAWESVYFIQTQMFMGSLLRGIHHFMAQAMIVLLALHMLQVIVDGAYRAPREVNFWIGLVLLVITLGLSLTGYLLPWDQKGYWATNVATNLMNSAPVAGPAMQRLFVGGPAYGHHTLTRFFALHAGLLPFLMIVFIAVHVALFRKHGLKAKAPYKRADAHFWPDQVMRDSVACLAVLLVVVVLTLWKGAELGAPADPSRAYSAARPEWYFLFLFQMLKQFKGSSEVIGAFVVPGAVMLLLFLMPLIGKWKAGHVFNVLVIFALLGGVAYFTAAAKWEDQHNAKYHAAVEEAERNSSRAIELAGGPDGIPVSGAATLLREDPLTQGPRLFAENCASCHRFEGKNGMGEEVAGKQSASDLKGFGSREWLKGLLDPAQVATPHYFGATAQKDGDMVDFVTNKVAKYDGAHQAMLQKAVAAISAGAELKGQRTADMEDAAIIAEGRQIIMTKQLGCISCHRFESVGKDEDGPDLTGYASKAWLTAFLNDPGHKRFYGDSNDRMPAFGKKQILSAQEISLVADWLRGEWYAAGEAPQGQMLNSTNTKAMPATTRGAAAATQPASRPAGQGRGGG